MFLYIGFSVGIGWPVIQYYINLMMGSEDFCFFILVCPFGSDGPLHNIILVE